jgi:hypothetical protein
MIARGTIRLTLTTANEDTAMSNETDDVKKIDLSRRNFLKVVVAGEMGDIKGSKAMTQAYEMGKKA